MRVTQECSMFSIVCASAAAERASGRCSSISHWEKEVQLQPGEKYQMKMLLKVGQWVYALICVLL